MSFLVSRLSLNSLSEILLKKSSEMCYSASGSNQSYTHPTSCLGCVNRGKMIFWVCCCYYLVSSNNVNSVMSPITSGMRHIPFPRLNVPRGEVPGTVEHPQFSLDCMCHDDINQQPWLMLYIYNHPSQCCHHNSQKIWFSSWTVSACGTCSILGGLLLFVAMLLRLVMAWDWN